MPNPENVSQGRLPGEGDIQAFSVPTGVDGEEKKKKKGGGTDPEPVEVVDFPNDV